MAPGLSPVTSRNVRPKVPRLSQPVFNAISVTARSVSRSNAVARSMRRVRRYRCGGTPNARLNDLAKCASETPLTRARRRTGHCSCEAASILSFARSSRRSRFASWYIRRSVTFDIVRSASSSVYVNRFRLQSVTSGEKSWRRLAAVDRSLHSRLFMEEEEQEEMSDATSGDGRTESLAALREAIDSPLNGASVLSDAYHTCRF